MNTKMIMLFALGLALVGPLSAGSVSPAQTLVSPARTLNGSYLEVRSCDVYTGPCVANAEMGLSGKEGMLVWAIKEGSWKGTPLGGLTVIAVIRTDATLGNMQYEPRDGKAVLILDARANSIQQKALADFAKTMGGTLVKEVAETKISPIDVSMGNCHQGGCASVTAGKLVEISTRCFGAKDHLCGNEETFYPPLTPVNGAYPVYTEVAAYKGTGLNMTWESVGTRGAFLASFGQ